MQMPLKVVFLFHTQQIRNPAMIKLKTASKCMCYRNTGFQIAPKVDFMYLTSQKESQKSPNQPSIKNISALHQGIPIFPFKYSFPLYILVFYYHIQCFCSYHPSAQTVCAQKHVKIKIKFSMPYQKISNYPCCQYSCCNTCSIEWYKSSRKIHTHFYTKQSTG